ncbi:MCP four helix bundle domain-containing protein [Blastococcus sp. LR1]|uniref:MCP four helix bundle domain-containing protein n=1 Tax=Blastococcus sp. LR1 TaxID=2877000 RepID=UPI001CCC3AD3|nr:MCP four helix bundle domain-containing protein [Blastococcus sp. LR1]MCA0147148.1 MCP four helix bundle domain-containing protein [Blastococcus sp. LR1]
MRLQRLNVGQRLVAGFLVVVLCMVALTALGVIRVGQVSDRLTVINELNSVKQRYAINFRGSVHDRAIAVRDVVLAGSAQDVQAELVEIDRLAEFYADSAEELTASSPTTARSGRRSGTPTRRSSASSRPRCR